MAVVDDDPHSAYLLQQALLTHGAPEVIHLGDAASGGAALRTMLDTLDTAWPGLVIVDLKAHSGANRDFVGQIRALMHARGIPLVVMAALMDRTGRQELCDTGASAVFFRQADKAAYRREISEILSFWARNQRLDAVGM